jgi:hypothetical protein
MVILITVIPEHWGHNQTERSVDAPFSKAQESRDEGRQLFLISSTQFCASIHPSSWEVVLCAFGLRERGPIMTPVAATKKPRQFDPKTFLSIINGGRKIVAFAKKQTIFVQGDPSDAVFYNTERAGKTHRCVEDREGSYNRHFGRGQVLRRRVSYRATSALVFRCGNDRLFCDAN